MKFLLIFVGIITLSFSSSGQTQYELNVSANDSFKKADKELNTVYQKILKEYKEDTIFIKNLKKSQKIWIQFRDAEMDTKYPARESGYYGSIQPMCWSIYKTQLTEERIRKLKEWLTGVEEGDSCSGSVKIKN